MSKIIYKTGSIADATERYIVHGCNAQGKMNSGVAKVLRDQWPSIFDDYTKFIEKHLENNEREDLLGQVALSICTPTPENMNQYSWQVVINAFTQLNYGKDGKQYVSYSAIREVMRTIEKHFPGRDIAMPRIGAGLGGGDWDVIAQIIEEEAKTFQPVVYDL